MKRFFIFLLLFIAVSTAAYAEDTLRSQADAATRSVTIGDQFPYTLSIVVPEQAEVVLPRTGPAIGDFEVKNVQVSTKNVQGRQGYKQVEAQYTLVAYDLGALTIPTMSVQVRESNQGGELVFPPVPVIVHAIAPGPQDKGDIRDVKPPFSIPYPWLKILLGLLVLGLVAYAAWKYYLHRRKQPADSRDPAPLQPLLGPYQHARKRLDELAGRPGQDEEGIKAFYSEASEILREYLNRQFRIDALEMTTTELMAAIKPLKLGWDVQNIFKRWIQAADLVKFAKDRPEQEKAAAFLATAYELLDAFNPQQETAPALQEPVTEAVDG